MNDLTVEIKDLKLCHQKFINKANIQLKNEPCRIENYGYFVKVNWLIKNKSYMWKPSMGSDIEVFDKENNNIYFVSIT